MPDICKNVYFSNMSASNVLFEWMIFLSNIHAKDLEPGTISALAMVGAFCVCTVAEKTNSTTHIFHFKNVILLFNSWNFMIKPIQHRVSDLLKTGFCLKSKTVYYTSYQKL